MGACYSATDLKNAKEEARRLAAKKIPVPAAAPAAPVPAPVSAPVSAPVPVAAPVPVPVAVSSDPVEPVTITDTVEDPEPESYTGKEIVYVGAAVSLFVLGMLILNV
jgi:hypothetical protein